MISDHVDHDWEQIDKCVYCIPCKIRLYQGRLGLGINPVDKVRQAQFLDDIIEAAHLRAAKLI